MRLIWFQLIMIKSVRLVRWMQVLPVVDFWHSAHQLKCRTWHVWPIATIESNCITDHIFNLQIVWFARWNDAIDRADRSVRSVLGLIHVLPIICHSGRWRKRVAISRLLVTSGFAFGRSHLFDTWPNGSFEHPFAFDHHARSNENHRRLFTSSLAHARLIIMLLFNIDHSSGTASKTMSTT